MIFVCMKLINQNINILCVEVFEANIRLLGGLLSAHLLMEDTNFPGLSPDWYLGKTFSKLYTKVGNQYDKWGLGEGRG